VEEAVTSAGVLEPNVLICQRVVQNPNSCSVVTSPGTAYGTEATRRTSRPFEPDETLVKLIELSFETCRDITSAQCRSASKKAMFRLNAETPEVTALKAVAPTANQLLQFGMRIRTERVITMD